MNKSLTLFMVILTITGVLSLQLEDAYAAVPTITAQTGSASGNSSATTKIVVTFSEGVNATSANTKSAWSVSGNTVSTVSTIVNNDATCNSGSGGTTSLTITLGTAIDTDAVPQVTYNGTGPNISIKSCTTNQALVNASSSIITPTDGLSPVFVSAKTTSPTTINVVFSESVINNAAVNGDFTIGGTIVAGTTSVTNIAVSGNTITLTLDNSLVEGDTPTVSYSGGANDIEDTANNNDLATFSAQTVTNSLASNIGGNGCDGDCEEPTLGVDNDGRRLVDDGFTYNGYASNVERFFTPYPLITVDVGKQNKAEFKIYDNEGPEAIKHFSFAFGLGKNQVISQSKAMIELDIDFDGTQTIVVTDPENTLDDIHVETDVVSCSENSQTECLGVTIYHTFRESLDFNIVGTDIWDQHRNSWQNYYNHGIEVVGESLNPPRIHDGINKGHIYHLTETGKNTAVDEFGNTWTFDKTWAKDYIHNKRPIDPNWNVFTRMHSEFAKYKDSQANDAIKQLLVICPTCLNSYDDFADSTSIDYPDRINKLDNPEIQKKMIFEYERAQKIMNSLLDPYQQ